MEFEKYKKWGAYHFKQYEDKNTKYSRHADRVVEWIRETDNTNDQPVILDIGAGDGLITKLLNAKGVDNEPIAVKLAQEQGVDVVLGSAYELPFQDEEFEVAFMGDVLEHLPDYRKALQEAKRVIRKYLYLVTPTKGTQNDPYHVKEWSVEELIQLVREEGFEIETGGVIMVVPSDKRIYIKLKKK